MKKKPLSYYLDLMKSAQNKKEWVTVKRYGKIALKKINALSYSPLEQYLLYSRLGPAYFYLTEYSRSIDSFYKAHLIAEKQHLNPDCAAFASFGLATSFQTIRNINQALFQYQKVDRYYQKYGENSSIMNKQNYLITLIGLGFCRLYNKDLTQVKEIVECKLASEHISLSANKLALMNYFHLKGEYLMAIKDYQRSRQSFKESIQVSKEINHSRAALEAEIHKSVIELSEGHMDKAIEQLQISFKDSKRLNLQRHFCEIGLLLSKCYALKNMNDKAIFMETRIKPVLNKLDITWLYEKTREFEQLYHQLQQIYKDDAKPIPVILENAINNYYASSSQKSIIVGHSEPMQKVYQLIEKIAPTDLPVLIQGETGTGKELFARAIHHKSLRAEKPLLALNCAAIPESLLENELFGHSQGAFTDAHDDRRGYIELASDGTLFLDEIADMSPNMQQKLLRVLEEKQVWRLGAEKSVPVNTRFIFASNQDIEELVKQRKLREDLYYRINTIVINLPSLRDRKDDIPLLVNHFLEKYSTQNRSSSLVSRLSSEALSLLLHYNWPGNVRELENEIKRIYTLYPDTKIITEELLSESIRKYGPSLFSSPILTPLKGLTDSFQQKLIEDALRETKGNIAQAAKLLDCNRPNLYKKMRQLKISNAYVTKR